MKTILLRVTTIIALVEFSIMLVFESFSFEMGMYAIAVLDVFLLVITSTPMIYFWIIKPYAVERDAAMQQVSHMAYHDTLTQLANRRLLTEHLNKLISMNVRVKSHSAILFIDLDGFKRINDEYGHDVGDSVLIEVAKRLSALARNEDIVSRLGGDEFVILLSQVGTDQLLANKNSLVFAQRVLKEISKDINFKDSTHQIGASIGLRLLLPEVICAVTSLKDADIAMYRAKRAGKGQIVFH